MESEGAVIGDRCSKRHVHIGWHPNWQEYESIGWVVVASSSIARRVCIWGIDTRIGETLLSPND